MLLLSLVLFDKKANNFMDDPPSINQVNIKLNLEIRLEIRALLEG